MSEDSEDIIKKLTEDVPDGKATFPADEDDEFNLLLDNFIQSELKNIEEEKNNTRIMLEEPEPQPIKQNASDDEVADALELAEQKLYTAYRNYVDSIQAIADAQAGLALNDGNVNGRLAYAEAVCYEYLGDFQTALQKFTAYRDTYGSSEAVEHEISFLQTRVQ